MHCAQLLRERYRTPAYREAYQKQREAIKNMTAGQKVKLEDGTEEDHKVINTKDPAALKNLADWMLSH